MIISESGVLSKGIESYFEKTDFEKNILDMLNAIPVQRNKGIDGFIKSEKGLIVIINMLLNYSDTVLSYGFCASDDWVC